MNANAKCAIGQSTRTLEPMPFNGRQKLAPLGLWSSMRTIPLLMEACVLDLFVYRLVEENACNKVAARAL